MSAEAKTETITFYGLAKAAYDEAGGDREIATEILLGQIERNDPPYVVLRRQLLMPAIRERLSHLTYDDRRKIWNGSSAHIAYGIPLPPPLVEGTASSDAEDVPVVQAVQQPVEQSLRVIDVAPRPPVPDLPGASAVARHWEPNLALRDRIVERAKNSLLNLQVLNYGKLGDLTYQQVRQAIEDYRRRRRVDTSWEIFLSIICKDKPGYGKPKDDYSDEQLRQLKDQAVLLASNVRLLP